jgi:hypothetical protein
MRYVFDVPFPHTERWSMLDPYGFETFDPYADETAATEAALYGGGCGPGPWEPWPPIDP